MYSFIDYMTSRAWKDHHSMDVEDGTEWSKLHK